MEEVVKGGVDDVMGGKGMGTRKQYKGWGVAGTEVRWDKTGGRW